MADLDLGTLRAHVELDDAQFDKKYQNVTRLLDNIDKAKPEAQVGADTSAAEKNVSELEDRLRRVVDADTVAQVDAAIGKAEKNLAQIEADLGALEAMDPTPEVDADITKARAALGRAESALDALKGERAEMVVDADTSAAEDAIGDLPSEGDAAGEAAGSRLSGKIVAALATIPIAGAVVGIGAAIGQTLASAIQDGLGVEKRQDRLQALTGITEGQAATLGRAAGEAYADTFGESIESNMETARIAVQQGLLDPNATARQAQQVISSLSGIADVLDEDVRPVSVAVTQLLKTGLVKTADEAFDLLATGAREGVNAQEDLLDTFTEYPALFQRLGLSGAEALGLINQGLNAGARNSDLAADALKEFQIRATDGSKASAEGFKILGLNAADMTAQIAQGGESARNGLDTVLDKLREIEDPVARNAAAVALFGTQAEDLGEALFAMDLSNAVDQLNGVQGAAQRMFDTLADNDATKIEEARRNIEVAADGIKGALAAAFSEPIGDFATFVSENRGAVVAFLLEIANGALDIGRSVVEGMAAGTEAIGEFISGPMADLMVSIADAIDASDEWLPGAQDSTAVRDIADGMRDFKSTTDSAADAMRTNLIENGIDPAQQRLNEFGIPQVLQAEFHDATLRAAQALDAVGYSAETGQALLDAFTVAQDGTVTAGSALESQMRSAVAALDAEAAAGARAGESQESLAQKYELGRQALFNQLVQMGMTEDQAWALIDTYGAVPGKVDTAISSNAGAVTVEVGGLAYKVEHLPDGSFQVTANVDAAQARIDTFIASNRGRTIGVSVETIVGNPSMGFNPGRGSYSSGGYTGPGGKFEPAGVVHRGEFVFDQETTAKHRSLFEAIHNDTLPGFAGGGFVGAAPASPVPPVRNAYEGQPEAQSPPVVYVQNPFTGEYLLAKVAHVADARVAEHGVAQDRTAQYL
ncbi:phage tail tape measure protein [Cellulosimicrobium sp. XJ-DQ-B-000]|uniref:phage tail tape measure protein n=1 Tax=Cellulosimicrobium sp. XJ-DQ-B-000 TaxID=3072182 RepID=UPI002806CCA2|nr:phage tail tape measure protein [Cellulosimicrobium sp. XJ-DQ-B-000]MDQ8040670.1 phage tail tape measure protein [Cellulosimicrobium sp. XJ-DQ-B-000]